MRPRERNRAALRRHPRAALAGALLVCALLFGAARAGAVAPAPSDEVTAAAIGRYCTPRGCSGSLESALGNAAGFGAAALAAVLLARRRSA